MPVNNNRLLLELENYRRAINREIINPQFPKLTLDDLKPLLTLVAHSRAAYLHELLDIANASSSKVPSQEQIKRLQTCREAYDELVAATNALETVIHRDYLDVKSSSPHGD